ncbi:MAG: hypothetical protein IPP07_25415 [Holophagales bacterium]|nr:hypothetical protein [Holophagales bacterium]
MTTLLCATAQAQVSVTATAGTTGPTAYTTLGDAFTAINGGTHQGTIAIAITGDTTETATATLNASGSGSAVYGAISIQPSGGAARTISGAIAAGSPLIDFNGADAVTIDGLNSGGNALTISNTTVSSTSGTSTIRFQADATNNTITNTSILGSSTMASTTNGGNIWFGAGAVTTGNDGNTISSCNIGPAGTNLPTKAVYGNGSTASAAVYNSGNTITGNNIFDFFNAAAQSNGLYLAGGNTDWIITNNRFYQTATRTQTTGAIHSAIQVASSTGNNNHNVSGNIIGYSSAAGTGTYTFVGIGTGSKFLPIYFSSAATTTPSSIQGNTITAISLSGVVGGTSTSGAFVGISIASGVATIGSTTGNTIGSATVPGAISITSNNGSAMEVLGIYYFPSAAAVISNNVVGGITASNTGAGSLVFYGIRANTSSSVSNTIQNNAVGSEAAPIPISATSTASRAIGLYSQAGAALVSGNVISNLSLNAANVGTGSSASVIGLWIDNSSATAGNNVSQNTVRSLSNSSAAAAVWVTGLQYNGATTGTHTVQRNFIHSISTPSTSATATVNGINVQGGLTTYQNNIVVLGNDMTANGPQINGINESVAGTDNLYHNSVYIGGSGVAAGTANSFAFQSGITVNTRNYRDNVFVNARSNGAATGRHYAIRVGGTAANPGGLTSNNNVLYAPGTGGNTGLFNLLDQTTLAAWQSATGQDSSSFAADPKFLAPTAATPNLHINPAVTTVIEGNGFAVATVTDDFDGEARGGLTPTDIGADAGLFLGIDLAAPAISYTPLANTSQTTDRSLVVTIEDTTGVAAAGLSPRVYYRKGAGTYFSQPCSLSSGTAQSGTWTCPIVHSDLGGVVATDVVSYFVIAQDTLGNVSSSPSGAVATDVNTVTAPPATPSSYLISVQYSGSYNVGTGETFTSLTNAGGLFDALNLGVVTGNLTIHITTDLVAESGAVALNQLQEEGAGGYTMTVQPSGGARSVAGTGTGTLLIKLNGADRITFNGSLTGTGTDRSLTFTNGMASTSASVFWFASTAAGNGATFNSVRNCVVTGNAPTTTFVGIVTSGSTLGGVAEAPNSNNSFVNNAITAAQYGIAMVGPTANETGNHIKGNTIGSTVAASKMGYRGIAVFQQAAAEISGNVITGVVTATVSTASGILVSGTASGILIKGNQISDVKNTNSGGYGSNGIQLNSSSTAAGVAILNNFISDVASYGWTAAALGDNGYGIVAATGGGYSIYNNTISLLTSQTLAGSITAAINVTSGITTAGSIDLRNNVLSNQETVGTRYAIYSGAAATVYANINYNDYFAQNVGFLGTAQATLAGWQGVSLQDLNSLAVDPLLRSATDLHLLGTSPMLGAGTSLAAVPADFDDDPRPGTALDIGADEVVQAVAGSIPAGTYYNALGASGDVLGGAVNVTNELTLTGILGTGANTLSLGCTATVTGAGATNYVVGNLKKTFCATGAKSFEVGTANGYSPVDAGATAGTFPADLTVTAVQGPQPFAYPSALALQRYWPLAGSGLTVDLTFHYLDADIPVTATETSFIIFRFNGAAYATPGGIVSPASNQASITGVSSFSDWTLAEPGTTPVELLNFSID